MDTNQILKRLNNDFIVEHTDARPLFVSGIVRGFVDTIPSKKYNMVLCIYEKGELDWVTLLKDHERIFNGIIDAHKKNRRFWEKQFESWHNKEKRVIEKTFKKLKYKRLSGLSDKEIMDDMASFLTAQFLSRKANSFIDAFNIISYRRLSQILEEYEKSNPGFESNTVFESITRPKYESFLNVYAKEIRDIRTVLEKRRPAQKRVSLGDIKEKKVVAAIRRHLDRFCWIKTSSFYEGKEYGYKELMDEIHDIPQESSKKEKSGQPMKMVNHLYMFDPLARHIAELVNLFHIWADQRKEESMMTTYLATRYAKELAQRKGWDFNALCYLDFSEIQDMIRTGTRSIKDQGDSAVFIFYDGFFRRFNFEESKDIIDKVRNKRVYSSDSLKGLCASRGMARGKARIIMRISDIRKVERGDILIAPTTRPEHLPAMKRAAAIVTDEGGITSHAAIVSRELGIPCVIGTNIATKVLKDGDLVEVDAEKGTISIIKRS